MKMRAIGVVSVTLVSLGSASGVQSSPSASAEFVGTMPCGDAIRAFVGGLSADAPCHAVTLRFDLAATDSTGAVVWMMDATYGVPPRSNPNLMITGPRVITRGSVEHSGNTYRLMARSGKTISFRQISSTLIHPIDDQGRLLIGTDGWSYTLSRGDSTDDKGRPTIAQGASRSLMPRASGAGVFGIFEGRTPCMGIARALRVRLDDGCQKVKWRVTLLHDSATREPTRYRVEGTLHRSAGGREGAWRVVRGTTQDSNATVLQLDATATEPAMLLWKIDDNLLLFLDGRKEPLTGTIDFSYTLNRSR